MPTDDNEDADDDDDDDDDVDDFYFVLLGFIQSQSPPGLRQIWKLSWKPAGKPQCPSVRSHLCVDGGLSEFPAEPLMLSS